MLSLGDTKGALDAAGEALTILDELVKQRPDDREWRRDLVIAYRRMGEVQSAQGLLSEALESCKMAAEGATQIVEFDRDNPPWQRLLSVSWGQHCRHRT